MSSLRTHIGSVPIVRLDKDMTSLATERFKISPGEWVTHYDCGGLGIVVSIDFRAASVTVLWSKEPDYGWRLASIIDRKTGRVDPSYNPLAHDEDIYVPVKPDTVDDGMQSTGKDVSWVVEQLRRMCGRGAK